MKNSTPPNCLRVAFLAAIFLLTGLHAYAQYPAASALLSNNIEHYSINSSDDYLRIEHKINSVTKKVSDIHNKYPNVKYTPTFSNNILVGFIITGLNDNDTANDLSMNLMLLNQLGEAVGKMDVNFLPNVDDNKLSRVSRKVANQ
jgi:hypothetical protein